MPEFSVVSVPFSCDVDSDSPEEVLVELSLEEFSFSDEVLSVVEVLELVPEFFLPAVSDSESV